MWHHEARAGLTPSSLGIYIASMFYKVVAASCLAVWLALLGIDFAGDTGLIPYAEVNLDQSVDAVLSDLGEAIEISKAFKVAISLPLRLSAAYLYPDQSLYLEGVSLYRLKKEPRFAEEHFKIHKLYQVFLI